MARTSTAVRSLRDTPAPLSSEYSNPEPASGVHACVAPISAAETFSSWVNAQRASRLSPRDELEPLEERLIQALHARDIPFALLYACSIAYLDPEHEAAQRIKRRCVREMERPRSRGEQQPSTRTVRP